MYFEFPHGLEMMWELNLQIWPNASWIYSYFVLVRFCGDVIMLSLSNHLQKHYLMVWNEIAELTNFISCIYRCLKNIDWDLWMDKEITRGQVQNLIQYIFCPQEDLQVPSWLGLDSLFQVKQISFIYCLVTFIRYLFIFWSNCPMVPMTNVGMLFKCWIVCHDGLCGRRCWSCKSCWN